MPEWKPGDVARVDAPDGQRVFYVGASVAEPRPWRLQNGAPLWGDFNMRPLVVVDPEDREEVERVRDALWKGGPIDAWQSALREFADQTPSKPDEPTGLGAVVEDARGRCWLRDYERGMRPWRPIHESPANGRHAPNTLAADREGYADIAAVRVLSDGVQP